MPSFSVFSLPVPVRVQMEGWIVGRRDPGRAPLSSLSNTVERKAM
jgi:hypothetical protein